VLFRSVNAITLVGGTSRTICKIGHFITNAALELARIDETWGAPDSELWVRLAIIDASGRRAWTNPIWLAELPE
jgi:hypothetical protein